MSTADVNAGAGVGTGAMGSPRIAVLGTGKMGSAIAGRLADEGFELTLWNRTRAHAEALGIGRVAETPKAAALAADVVISSLTGPEAVRATYLGPDGALGAGADRLFIEMSTAGPDLVHELAQDVVAAGDRLVDAPIVGAPTFMRVGKATILVGGDDADVERAVRVLGGLGTVRHVGPLGNGARLKLVANSMLADVILAATELQVAGERSGLAPDDVFWLLQRMSPMLAARHDGIVDDHHEPVLFALRDLLKDLDFALPMFERADVRTPLTARARQLVAAAASRYGDLDITAVELSYRQAEPKDAESVRAAGA